MEQSIIYLTLILTGLCLGSFAGASVWRLRAYQLKQDKADGDDVDLDEYKSLERLMKTSKLKDRSMCLNCHYVLSWYDMIPLVSWLSLRGKCRKCRKPIGYMEPLIELGVAVFFVMSYAFWPYSLGNGLEIARLVLWLVSGVGLAILFAYDQKWFLLPPSVNFAVIGIGACNSLLVILGSQNRVGTFLGIASAVLILSGLYWILGKVSDGKWIGAGDVWLGLGLALLLANWGLAFIALFAANLIGCLIVLPALITRKLSLKSHVPFGPLLIIGAVIAELAGNYLINIYFYSLV
jgi:prepilin signal peptidase PulO-like enzyme (type II secretory pathway)